MFLRIYFVSKKSHIYSRSQRPNSYAIRTRYNPSDLKKIHQIVKYRKVHDSLGLLIHSKNNQSLLVSYYQVPLGYRPEFIKIVIYVVFVSREKELLSACPCWYYYCSK